MVAPLFPTSLPRLVDPLWFNVDRPCDDEHELSKLEEEYQNRMNSVVKKDEDILPIGKKASDHEHYDEEEEDDDDDDDDSGSGSNEDDELDTDMIDERDSPEEVDMDNNDNISDAPIWVSM